MKRVDTFAVVGDGCHSYEKRERHGVGKPH